MPVDSLQEQVGRDGLGRFRKGRSGNPRGRVAGSRNRATEIAEALMEGEAPAVTRKLVERALTGNSTAMRLYFERLVPPRRERPVRIAMPEVAGPGDVNAAMAAITRAVVAGEVSPADAGELARMVETLLRTFQAGDFDRRLCAIEEALAGRA